jgi:hypothetical protein
MAFNHMGVQIWVGHLIGPHMSRLGGEARIYGRVTHSDLAIFGDKLFYKKLLSSVQSLFSGKNFMAATRGALAASGRL